eukprot:CAMPEP_0185839110 /NCGR_PEP_ID=MMETSP1353-20130828/14053_1 /TAXON_ID=1077150 /ORGANISM="Erythrolobus australicus, Strain CCMP3124" /LENGTH=199 /DNA_ID=CAMNT_0028538227 /DNA_START=146 /DNA_END=742 /DNA_ORIENTATION=-
MIAAKTNDEDTLAVLERDVHNAEPLVHEAEPDLMNVEQTWPPETLDEEIGGETASLEPQDGAGNVDVEHELDEVGADDGTLPPEVVLEDDKRAATCGEDAMLDDDAGEENLDSMRSSKNAARSQDERFPDEVDTPIDRPARERFARYRGLKSFRTSAWDAKEMLPPSYGKIFEFAQFALTRKRIFAHEAELERREPEKL